MSSASEHQRAKEELKFVDYPENTHEQSLIQVLAAIAQGIIALTEAIREGNKK